MKDLVDPLSLKNEHEAFTVLLQLKSTAYSTVQSETGKYLQLYNEKKRWMNKLMTFLFTEMDYFRIKITANGNNGAFAET